MRGRNQRVGVLGDLVAAVGVAAQDLQRRSIVVLVLTERRIGRQHIDRFRLRLLPHLEFDVAGVLGLVAFHVRELGAAEEHVWREFTRDVFVGLILQLFAGKEYAAGLLESLVLSPRVFLLLERTAFKTCIDITVITSSRVNQSTIPGQLFLRDVIIVLLLDLIDLGLLLGGRRLHAIQFPVARGTVDLLS